MSTAAGELNYRTTENVCIDCGRKFIIRRFDYANYAQQGWNVPKRCAGCRHIARQQREAEKKAVEDAEWQKAKALKQEEFEKKLEEWNVVRYNAITPAGRKTLCIIGNGFDMMHGVKSSYYSFRDSLGRNSRLRQNLETFLTVEDIWADFENALAHIDMQYFTSRLNADNWLDICGAYEEDTGMAEFFMAAEYATQAVSDMVDDLQRRFYSWVSQLTIGTKDRPLQSMLRDGSSDANINVLSFNYTEFIEELYEIPENNVCYIHGCCKKRSGVPREKLILGHAPNASEEEFKKRDHTFVDMRSRKRREMVYAVQDIATRQLIEYDKELTKDCARIIEEHDAFFNRIRSSEVVITIGHSLSEVDWPYFEESISRMINLGSVQWYFGCHGLRDLENLEKLIQAYGVDRKKVTVFRTDLVRVEIDNTHLTRPVTHPRAKVRCKSSDDKWKVQSMGEQIQIVDVETDIVMYSVEFLANISSMFFLPNREMLFLISNDYPSGIFVFGIVNGNWCLLFDLEQKEEYTFLTRSLNRILINGNELIFVYKNRVRVHSLIDGRVVRSSQFKGAGNQHYVGEDITDLFSRNK